MASKGLDAEWGHNKCSYRRAMARLQMSPGTQGGDFPQIRGAMKDVINSDPGDATRKLLLRIEKEVKRLGRRERHHFGSEFASAMSGAMYK